MSVVIYDLNSKNLFGMETVNKLTRKLIKKLNDDPCTGFIVNLFFNQFSARDLFFEGVCFFDKLCALPNLLFINISANEAAYEPKDYFHKTTNLTTLSKLIWILPQHFESKNWVSKVKSTKGDDIDDDNDDDEKVETVHKAHEKCFKYFIDLFSNDHSNTPTHVQWVPPSASVTLFILEQE